MPTYSFTFPVSLAGQRITVFDALGNGVENRILTASGGQAVASFDLPTGTYEARVDGADGDNAKAVLDDDSIAQGGGGGGFDESGSGAPTTDPTTVDPGYTYLDTANGALYMVILNPTTPGNEWVLVGGEIDGVNNSQGIVLGNGLALLGRSQSDTQVIITDVDAYNDSGLGIKWIGTGTDGQQGFTVDAGSGGISLNTTDGVYLNSLIRADGPVGTKSNAAPSSGSINPNEVYIWFDSTDGASKVMFKGKSADGTIVSGNVALS